MIKIPYFTDMLTKADIETTLRNIKPVLMAEFKVSRIGYFGSFATGNQNDTSDLDILVEFSEPIGWKFFTLEQFLERSFGIPIDLVTKNALKERVKEPILNQIQYV